MKKNYVILEIIPTKIDKGEIVQLSALKIKNSKIIDRFDYRLNPNKVNNLDLIMMTSYNKDNFKYVNSSRKIKIDFKKWVENYELLIMDNLYTKNYIKYIKNNKKDIFSLLNLKLSDDIIDIIKKKYNLKDSNHIVDLLYEALIFESNK